MRGNSGTAPLKVLDEDGLASGGKRFRFIPLSKRLQSASARPTSLPLLDFESNLADVAPDDTSFSHFKTTLSTEADSNITTTFVTYHKNVNRISTSLPLLYRNRKKLVDETLLALETSTRNAAEATVSISRCLAALSRDLGPEMFYPFFPRVIEAMSCVFTVDRQRQTATGDLVQKTREHSVLWDPEASVIPLFATLAEITKILLKRLSSDPQKTIQHLSSLLSNPNRRLREMTSEACLGYLLRKTRDSASLEALVTALMKGVTVMQSPSIHELHFIDGLGASLFESLRVPHGRMHSKAWDIIRYAIRSVGDGNKHTEVMTEYERKQLSILARCFRDVSRHVTNDNDLDSLSDLFVSEGRHCLKENSVRRMGGILFLLRKWINATARSHVATIEKRNNGLIFQLLSDSLKVFTNNPWVVYETFGGILTLVLCEMPSDREHAIQTLRSIFLLASQLGPTGVAAVLHVVLFSAEMDLSLIPPEVLLKSISPVYERLACLYADTNPELPLLASILLFRLLKNACPDEVSFVGLKVPSIEKLIVQAPFFANDKGDSDTEKVKSGLTLAESHSIIEFLSHVRVPGVERLFTCFLDSCDSWQSAEFPRVLIAFANNFSEETNVTKNYSESDLHKRIAVLARDALFRDALQSRSLLQALCNYTRRFPSLVRDWLLEDGDQTKRLFGTVSKGLSSPSTGVRLGSATLLSNLYSMSTAESNSCPSLYANKSVDRIVEKLRFLTETSSDPSFEGVYDAFALLLSVPKSLEAIAGHERVLRELVRTSSFEHVYEGHLNVFVQFSIGLLRTPLKVLWDGARGLWCEMSKVDTETAMQLILEYMDECETRLLSKTTGSATEQRSVSQTLLCSTKSHSSEDNQNAEPCRPRLLRVEEKSAVVIRSTSRSSHRHGSEWDPFEWNSHDIARACLDGTEMHWSNRFEHQEPLDAVTSFVQTLNVLSEQPQHTLRFRSKLIRSFLNLNSSAHDCKGLFQVLSGFSTLLERMGGLKCTESDVNLEQRMRDFLLSNLTKNHTSLQTASVRCICISRSPHLKPYRDSFIRLLSDKTFREELALLTDSLFSQGGGSGQVVTNFGDKEKNICDVLTRISFSKIKGKQNKLDSKRSAVLSFLVAKTPWKLAMPMLESLAIAPIESEIYRVERMPKPSIQANPNNDLPFPGPSVQKGILFSIEAIVKNCRKAMPEDSWIRLGIGTTILLRNSSQGSTGKAVRSRALSILAEMLKVRSSETEQLVGEVLQAMRDAEFETSELTDGTGVPALMHFVDAVMSSTSTVCKAAVLKEHQWALRYCIQSAKNSAAGVKAVFVSLSVGQGFADTLSELHDNDVKAVSSHELSPSADILDCTCNTLRQFYAWITDLLTATRAVVKTWTPAFLKAMSLTTSLARLSSARLKRFSALYPLADGLCGFLEMNVGQIESRSKALLALESIIASTTHPDLMSSLSETHQVEALIVRLLPLLNTWDIAEDQDAIYSLCGIIANSQSRDLAIVGEVLKGFYAFDASKLSEPDYDRRIQSLSVVIDGLKKALNCGDNVQEGKVGSLRLRCLPSDLSGSEDIECGPTSFLALLHGCLSAVHMNDTAVRGTGGYSISLMAKWVGSVQEEAWILPRTQMLRLLVSAVTGCKTLSIRREYCRSLGELVRWSDHNSSRFCYMNDRDGHLDWDSNAVFSVMEGLANADDIDADFFENLVHLQPHRRGRALRQVGKYMKEYAPSSPEQQQSDSRAALELFSLHFAIPLGLNVALEKLASDEARSNHLSKHNESREGAQKDVLNWAIDLIGTATGFLGWASYKHFLSNLLRKLDIEKDEDNVKVLLKILVSTSASYPKSDDVGAPGVDESTDFLVGRVIPKMLKYVNPSAVEANMTASNEGHRFFKANKRGTGAISFRAPVAVAIAELMTFLPVQYLDSHISLLIAPLSGALRSRASGPRDEAKKALTAVVLVLGPKYFNYVLGQVLNALKDGYRRDACVYVIHAVLSGIHKSCRGKSEEARDRKDFPVDSACNGIVSFLLKELESGIGESKNDFADPNVSSERERKCSLRAFKAFECVSLLAEHINFEETARVLIEPFLRAQNRTASSKLVKKLRTALKHMMEGFSRNQSLKVEAGLTCCYAYANLDSVPDREELNKLTDPMQVERQVGNEIEGMNFGLQLLNIILSRNAESMKATDEKGRRLQSMCEPFLGLVARALTLGDDDLTLLAFRSCQKLLKLPLSNRTEVANRLSETIVDVLGTRSAGVASQGNAWSGDELFNTCLRAGAVLVHEVGPRGFEVVSRDRVEALVTISCDCIEHGSVDSRSAAIALLRAVVTKKIMLPCVYDAMEKVKEMAIYSHSTALQKSCIKLCVRFLVTFPLGSKRVRQTVEFFVRNLNYSSASGRIGAVQALETIISEFPQEALEEENEYLFVALTSGGARDADRESRNRCLECLKVLFQKWDGGRQTDKLLRMGAMLAGVRCSMSKWEGEAQYCGATDDAVQRGGLVGLTAGGMSGKLKKGQLEAIARVGLVVGQAQSSEKGWETMYRALRCIECCIESQDEGVHELEVDERMFWIWEKMSGLLVDKHEWVRLSACRLLGRHLSAARGKDEEIGDWKERKGWIWSRNDVVRETMKSLCLELESSHVSMELAEQAVKNILGMARVMRLDRGIGDVKKMGDDGDDGDDEKESDELGRTLRWLVTRMSGMASRGGKTESDLVRRGCGIRFLIVSGTWWGRWILEKVGGLYIRATVKVLEDGSLREGGGKGKRSMIELGQRLQEVVLEHMESEKYFEEYRGIAGRKQSMRAKRRREVALRGATDGEQAAKRRRRGREAKRAKKGGKRRTRASALTEDL